MKTLTFLERTVLAQVLPTENGYIENLVVKALRKKLDISLAEIDEYKMVQLPDGRLAWGGKAVKMVFDIEATERETRIIKFALESLEAAKKLPEALTELFIDVCKPEIPEDLK